MDSHIISSFDEAAQCLQDFSSDRSNLELVEKFIELLTDTFKKGKKVLSAGNGGSHCDAMHFAEEWTGRYRDNRPPKAALAISDPSNISCIANDFGFEHVFERSIQALGDRDDVFLAITTSGNSQNLILAARAAKIRGMKVVGLLGKGGGTLKPLCDIAIIAPGETSDRIQELHIKVIHIVIECAERRLYPELYGQDKQQLNLIEMSKDDYDIGLQDSVVLETSLIQYIDDGYRIKVTNLAGISEEAVKSNDGLKLVNWNPKYLHAA